MTPTLAQIKTRHVKVDLGCGSWVQGEMCYICKEKWPCDAAFLLQEVERLESMNKSQTRMLSSERGTYNDLKQRHTSLQQKLAQAEASNYDLRRYTAVLKESRDKAEARLVAIKLVMKPADTPGRATDVEIAIYIILYDKQQEGAR